MADQSAQLERGIDTGKLVTGVLLLTLGVIFLLDRVYWLDFGELVRWWPIWLIALGVSHVVWPRRGRGRLAGFWPVLIGAIFLLDVTDTLALHDSWPLFIVGAGILMVLRSMGIGRYAGSGCRPAQPQEKP